MAPHAAASAHANWSVFPRHRTVVDRRFGFASHSWVLKFDGTDPNGVTVAILFSGLVDSIGYSGFAAGLSHFDLGLVAGAAVA